MPRNLLLADDSITIQKVVGITFAQEDYNITYTDNGEDAVKKAKEIKPDIILADIIMPQRNGYEVCENIKKDPELSHIPVLLLAGTFETFDESRGKQVGADGYIIKPFESQALIDKVNHLVQQKAAPSFEIPAPTPAMQPPEAIPQAEAPSPELPETDRRMEPMLDVEPTFEAPEPPTETFEPPESPIATPESTPEAEPVPLQKEDAFGRPEITEPKVDLASPAEFIMDATTSNTEQSDFMTEPPQKEDFVEVSKPPTFDFVSGESDLKVPSEPSGFVSSPDLTKESEPANERPEASEITTPPFEEPAVDFSSPEISPEMEEAKPQIDEIPKAEESPEIVAPPAEEPVPQELPKLSEAQMEDLVKKVSQAVVEKIAWEVVPETAERIIREEIKRLTEEE